MSWVLMVLILETLDGSMQATSQEHTTKANCNKAGELRVKQAEHMTKSSQVRLAITYSCTPL